MVDYLDEVRRAIDDSKLAPFRNALAFSPSTGGRLPHQTAARTPAGDGVTASGESRVFPEARPNCLQADERLQTALDDAIANGPGRGWPTAVAIVSLDPAGSRPFAHARGGEVHYTASLVKLGALYAAYSLRRTIREIARTVDPGADPAKIFARAAEFLTPAIHEAAGAIAALGDFDDTVLLPTYGALFEASEAAVGPGFDVDFTEKAGADIAKMITISDNDSASACIRNIGYGYLAGSLTAGGFFDPRTNAGVWVGDAFCADYPCHAIPAVNTGVSTQASTTTDLARLLTLLADERLVDVPSSREMLDLLAEAADGCYAFVDRASGLDFGVTHAKIGQGPWAGHYIYSEGAILEHDLGQRFVAVWQNYVPDPGDFPFDPIGHVVRDAIDAYLE